MIYDYAVIGGGVSGMTSALILAKQGFKTALIEKSTSLAPTIRGFERDGVYFDTGFHYTGGLGPGEPVDTFLRYLDLIDSITKVSLRQEGFDSFYCLDPDFLFEFPYGYEKIRQAFQERFPDDADAVDTYLKAVRGYYHSVPYVNLENDNPAGRMSDVHGQTLQEFLDGLTRNTMLKCILSMHCFLYGVSPAEVSMAQHAYVAGSYYESVHAISGGGRSLTAAFEERLNSADVNIYCGLPATSFLISSDGTFTGICLEDGTHIYAKGCISTVHPLKLLTMAPEAVFRPAYTKRLKELRETPSACILYAVCESSVEELERSNIFIFPTPSFDFFGEDKPVDLRPMYITAAGERTGAQQSHHGFIAICPMSREQTRLLTDPVSGERSHDYYAAKEVISREMTHVLQRSYPHIAEKIISVSCATPLTLRDYTNSPFGSLYGVQHRTGQYNPMPVTRLKGLFLAGQAVTAPGIMGAMMSAFVACGAIVGDTKIKQELKQCRIDA